MWPREAQVLINCGCLIQAQGQPRGEMPHAKQQDKYRLDSPE
jgi:hypothetical protein